ncbi:MAG: T9SS type A sorting domain-containing protein [Cryomorphaceae bacterium]
MKKLFTLFFVLVAPLFVVAQLTTSVSSTDITCFGDSNGTATISAGVVGASEPIVISEVNVNTPDFIELTNVSGQTVNTDGWFVITSDDYSLINDVNANSWDLPSSVASNWVDYREDATGSFYWGSNLFYSSGNPGWVLLSDDQGTIRDFVAWGWAESNIVSSFNVTYGSYTFDITTEWSGNGVGSSCSSSFIRTGNEDNDDATDWSCGTTSKGSLNSGISIPFLGGVGLNYLWSTGDTTNSISDLGPGTYYVTTTSSQGDTAFDTVTIVEPPIPAFTLLADTFLCDGSAIILDAGDGWDSYMWNNGTNGQTTLVTSGGYFTCTVTDTNGCPAVDSMLVVESQTPVVDLGADTIICDTQYVLDAGNAGASFLWSTGAFTQSILISETGTYGVTVTNSEGCEEQEDIYVQMFEPAIVDLGSDFTLCFNYNQTQFLNAGAGFTSYLWSTGATSTTLLVGSGVSQAGSELIHVIVETEDGCVGSDTVEVTYETCTGLSQSNGLDLVIYPNPLQTELHIEGLTHNTSQIEICDLTGKLVHSFSNFSQSNGTITLDVSEIPSGIYTLSLVQDRSRHVRKLIKY